MKKDTVIIIGIVLFAACIYGLTLRGVQGNPKVGDFKNNLDQPTKPFELSPERGRYVQVANLAEYGRYDLSPEWAAVAYPDVGISPTGKMDSYFAPGVSYMALPFYLIGRAYGVAQVATFSVETIMTIITLIFMYLIGRRVFDMPIWASLFSVLLFAFGSTSWSYAITLYQNAFTTCFVVTGFYAVWRFAQQDSRVSWLYAAYVWLAYALAIAVDYPNVILMLPVMMYLAYTTFSFRKVGQKFLLTIRWATIATSGVFMLITGVHLWHNAQYYGGPISLAGGLEQYTPPSFVQNATTTTRTVGAVTRDTTTPTMPIPQTKSAVHFFHEEKIPQSFYILLFSDERGLFYFMPVYILSLFGIAIAYRKKVQDRSIYLVPLALIGFNVFLYSSWGDPWGGWAYGPRYLIPSMPWLALFVGLFLASISKGLKSVGARLLVFVLFLYSCAIALLGALTTNAVPPKAEASLLPLKTFNFLHDLPFLYNDISGSFIYSTYFQHTISLIGYFLLLYSAVVLLAVLTLFLLYTNDHE